MKTYTAYFRTDADYATLEIKAATPEQALKKARRLYADDPLDLTFESYDGGMPVNEIAICDLEEGELALWQHDDLRLRLAAADLLEALRFCDMTLADLEASERKGYIREAKQLARTAIAKATGGAECQRTSPPSNSGNSPARSTGIGTLWCAPSSSPTARNTLPTRPAPIGFST